jgi:hypothetical protein
LNAVLGSEVTLVPCPRSSPLVEGGFWPGKIIAEALVRAGLGAQVLPLMERVQAVPKLAFQKVGERPDAQRHYETLRARADLAAGGRITLVDDFLTKGNTLLGAASRLAEVCPQGSIKVFALVRTLGLQPEVDRLAQPCVGRIRNLGGEAVREP